MKTRWVVIAGLFCILFSFGAAKPAFKTTKLRKVVIDAGHGGHDPGTMGKHSKEKDVTLAVALKLGRYVQENFPDVEVIYTRKTDVFIELFRRAKIANEEKADLFISIHCNGTKSPQARGTETWVMGLHKSKENLEVARMENASILMEDNYNNYDGFDPNSPEANIIFSLFQNVYLDKSLDMASKVEKHFREGMKRDDRGVKQAGFWVLYKTTMPGILIETGFLSNPDDESILISETGQDQIAYSIFQAFKEYKENMDGLSAPMLASNKTITSPVKEEEKPLEAPKAMLPATENNKVKETIKPVTSSVPASSVNVVPRNTAAEKPGSDLVYKVQIVSSGTPLSANSPLLKGVSGATSYKHKGVYKYVVGTCSSIKEAVELQETMQRKGFKDAFVVIFRNGARITDDEAKQLKSK